MKKNQGITLIALVITIIVLLILAGVSIALLTGDNGILTKANNASQQTKEQGALEKVKIAVGSSYGVNGLDKTELKTNLEKVEGIDKSTIKDTLPMTVKVDGIDVNIEENAKVKIEQPGELPTTSETKPFLPEGASVIENDLAKGVVIKDSKMNEWVWVEVPKSITENCKNDSEIETVLQEYASAHKHSSTTDTWYDECGLTEPEYYSNKSKMLQSLKTKGGFYVGRYETGTDRVKEGDSFRPLIQQDIYPYNFITSSKAQELAKTLATGGKTSGLLYGVQWNLVCKFIEEKGFLQDGRKVTQNMVSRSLDWGSYIDVTFPVNRGMYTTFSSYNPVPEGYVKPKTTVLLTPGATERNKVLNIYDLAGNLTEWTLENNNNSSGYPLNVFRGGSFYNNGSAYGANNSSYNISEKSSWSIGMRACMF